MLRRNNIPPRLFVAVVGGLFVICFLGIQSYKSSGSSGTTVSYKKWKECISPLLQPLTADTTEFWKSIGKATLECEFETVVNLKMSPLRNKDETKYHILPSGYDTKTTFITLGVGHDIDAEKTFRDIVGTENVEFFGADPITEINENLYSTIGKYYPFAVGAKGGMGTASVLTGQGQTNYHPKEVVYVDAVRFLKDVVQRTFVDELFFDAEGAEYDMFPFFYKGGQFDKNDITFCQINMEIHGPPTAEQKQLTQDFFLRLLEEERYAFVKVQSVGHLRVYIINMDNQRCREKYLS